MTMTNPKTLDAPYEHLPPGFLLSSSAAATTFFIGGKALAADPEFVVKLGTTAPAGTPWEKALKSWKRRVKEATGGRVRSRPTGVVRLVTSRPSRTVCLAGVQVYGGSAGARQQGPRARGHRAAVSVPNLKAADKALDGAYDFIDGMLNRRGYKLLFYSENGAQYRSQGELREEPSDLKGKKMRSQQTDAHLDTWRGLGLAGAHARDEVLSSLQTGVVDGFDNTPLFTFAASWYQAIDHYTLTQHGYRRDHRREQGVLGRPAQGHPGGAPGGSGAGHVSTARWCAPWSVLVENFRTAGIAVHESTASEKKEFAKATKSAHAKFRKKHSGDGSKMLAKFQAAM